MSKRTKTEVIISRAIFEQKVDTIASLQVSIQTLEAERDTRVEAILLHYNAQIKAHETEIKAEQQACQAYAQLNWSQLAPDGLRSAETPLATYGFRTGMPQVKKLVNRTEEEMAAELSHRARQLTSTPSTASTNPPSSRLCRQAAIGLQSSSPSPRARPSTSPPKPSRRPSSHAESRT
jgi:phage host-nuclease inhibitor protein Gam